MLVAPPWHPLAPLGTQHPPARRGHKAPAAAAKSSHGAAGIVLFLDHLARNGLERGGKNWRISRGTPARGSGLSPSSSISGTFGARGDHKKSPQSWDTQRVEGRFGIAAGWGTKNQKLSLTLTGTPKPALSAWGSCESGKKGKS